ncbi:hypothetical protein WJX73_010311 [Symbiochloris irregularis]|uniref:Uncharacterized protein n=1 Tax=Symbiochloris irregularis TaxID=706552 RepID=A0AAW1PIH8_9CHLO
MSKLLGYRLDAPFNTESKPTLLALYNVDDSRLHGLWVVEKDLSHTPADRVAFAPFKRQSRAFLDTQLAHDYNSFALICQDGEELSPDVIAWNLHLEPNELGTDLALLQLLNKSSGVAAVTAKTIEWELTQAGPISLVLFGGASCANYSFTEDCGDASSFVVDNTVSQQATKRAIPVSQIDSTASVANTPFPGIDYASQCNTDCSNKIFGLAETSAYDFVLSQSNDETCNVSTTFTAYNKDAPICQYQQAPANAQVSNIPTLRNDLQIFGSETNVSSLLDFNNASAWTFSGAACAYAGIYIPYDPTNVLAFLGMDLLTIEDYINAIDVKRMTADITNAPKVASCKGAACNATNTQGWLKGQYLNSNLTYVVVLHKNASLNSVNYTTSAAFVMLQTGTYDQCYPVVTAEAPAPMVMAPMVSTNNNGQSSTQN